MYRLLALFLLLSTISMVAIAAGSSPNGVTPSNPPVTPSNEPKRLKITVSITDPADLKVREGDPVAKDQVIADREQERARLVRERLGVVRAIAAIEGQIIPPLQEPPEIRELSPISFAIEEAQIQQAELKFSQAQRNLQTALANDPFITARARVDKAKAGIEAAYHAFELQQRKLDAVNGLKGLPPEMLAHETEKLRQKQSEQEKAQAEYDFYTAEYKQVEAERNATIADLQNKVQLARAELEIAQAQLRSAKELRDKAEYEHRITLARRAEEENQAAIALSNQKLEREFKLAQLKENLSATEEKLNAIAQIRSPYSGTIKRIKMDKQTDGKLTAVLYLVPSLSVSR
jgi:chromosome segregation ATPase